jgi:hypothetical protein
MATSHRAADLTDALRASSSVLLIASRHSDKDTFLALVNAGRPPFWWCDSTEFGLPAHPVGTLILKNPARLTLSEQRVLFEWIGRHPSAQILTVTSQPLYPAVQAGTFAEDLYYRLNALMIAGLTAVA